MFMMIVAIVISIAVATLCSMVVMSGVVAKLDMTVILHLLSIIDMLMLKS